MHINRFNIVDIGYTTSPKIAADFGYNFVSDIENIYAIARPVRQSQNVQKKIKFKRKLNLLVLGINHDLLTIKISLKKYFVTLKELLKIQYI